MKSLFQILISLFLLASTAFAQIIYPSWTYNMKILPFDVLYPFETSFAQLNGEGETSDEEIKNKLTNAKNEGANVIVFYIDNEQSYETFVDETGFNKTLNKIKFLVNEAHNRNLKVVCYLNGLEVITVGAANNQLLPSLARNYSDWLQIDIAGDKMVWYTTEEVEWIPGNSEDAWASPLSPWRNFFKQRIISLAGTGLDGVYIDATFLPGVDSFGIKWASSDSYFTTEFQNSYGLSIPTTENWNSEQWRKFIYFRHEIIRDYLGELAGVARDNGMIPFFESSSCDLANGTFLANDIPFTISGGIACSPEIEPEEDYLAAFRMSKVTRDANQNFPMWFLGWPETAEQARKEFAITLCHSGNYYPTADSKPPANAFAFINLIKPSLLDKRVPFQNTALIYPMRSKDYTFQTESTFNSYISAFKKLTQNHIPFRIMPLETITASDLEDINNVVLAGVESISDAEFNVLKNKTISLVGANGTKDKWGNTRTQVLNFDNVGDISTIKSNLPFNIKAPLFSYIEYYTDKLNANHYFIFVYSDSKSGEIIIDDSTAMLCKIYELNKPTQSINGTKITIPIADYLEVIELQISGTTKVKKLDATTSSKIELTNYPNPFNPITTIQFLLPKAERVSLKVYNTLGKLVATLINKKMNAGLQSVNFDASNLSSGLYFYKIDAGNFVDVKKMILLK